MKHKAPIFFSLFYAAGSGIAVHFHFYGVATFAALVVVIALLEHLPRVEK